jgi:hypothetical protein
VHHFSFHETWYEFYAVGDQPNIIQFNYVKSVCHCVLPESWHANDNVVTEFRIVKSCIVIDIGNVGTLHAGSFLGLFFDPENVGDMSLRNIGCLSTNYTALCPRR